MPSYIVAVHSKSLHGFSKNAQSSIQLVEGHGVAGSLDDDVFTGPVQTSMLVRPFCLVPDRLADRAQQELLRRTTTLPSGIRFLTVKVRQPSPTVARSR